jgi:hypothetical protein
MRPRVPARFCHSPERYFRARLVGCAFCSRRRRNTLPAQPAGSRPKGLRAPRRWPNPPRPRPPENRAMSIHSMRARFVLWIAPQPKLMTSETSPVWDSIVVAFSVQGVSRVGRILVDGTAVPWFSTRVHVVPSSLWARSGGDIARSGRGTCYRSPSASKTVSLSIQNTKRTIPKTYLPYQNLLIN